MDIVGLERSRCCFGCCNILSAGKAVAIFLLISSAFNLYLLWSHHPESGGSTVIGSTICICVMMIAAGFVIWGIEVRESWPCIFMIVLLAILTLACSIVAIMSIVGISVDCSALLDDKSPDANTVCSMARWVSIAFLIASLISAAFYVWFIFIFVWVRAYIVTLTTAPTSSGTYPAVAGDSIVMNLGGKNKEFVA